MPAPHGQHGGQAGRRARARLVANGVRRGPAFRDDRVADGQQAQKLANNVRAGLAMPAPVQQPPVRRPPLDALPACRPRLRGRSLRSCESDSTF